MSLFSAPKAPQEDPAVKAARERQARLAENDLTGQIQDQVRRRTRARVQQFGGGGASGGGGGMFAAQAASANPLYSSDGLTAWRGLQSMWRAGGGATTDS